MRDLPMRAHHRTKDGNNISVPKFGVITRAYRSTFDRSVMIDFIINDPTTYDTAYILNMMHDVTRSIKSRFLQVSLNHGCDIENDICQLTEVSLCDEARREGSCIMPFGFNETNSDSYISSDQNSTSIIACSLYDTNTNMSESSSTAAATTASDPPEDAAAAKKQVSFKDANGNEVSFNAKTPEQKRKEKEEKQQQQEQQQKETAEIYAAFKASKEENEKLKKAMQDVEDEKKRELQAKLDKSVQEMHAAVEDKKLKEDFETADAAFKKEAAERNGYDNRAQLQDRHDHFFRPVEVACTKYALEQLAVAKSVEAARFTTTGNGTNINDLRSKWQQAKQPPPSQQPMEEEEEDQEHDPEEDGNDSDYEGLDATARQKLKRKQDQLDARDRELEELKNKFKSTLPSSTPSDATNSARSYPSAFPQSSSRPEPEKFKRKAPPAGKRVDSVDGAVKSIQCMRFSSAVSSTSSSSSSSSSKKQPPLLYKPYDADFDFHPTFVDTYSRHVELGESARGGDVLVKLKNLEKQRDARNKDNNSARVYGDKHQQEDKKASISGYSYFH